MKGNLKTYLVQLCYSGYTVNVVEAESEDEAIRVAEAFDERKERLNLDLERWTDADMVEETVPIDWVGLVEAT
jgi:hypothetical protein